MRFRYFIVHRDHHRNEPRGLFAVNAEGVPFRRVAYSHIRKRWVFDPRVIDFLIGELANEAEEVTREQAEETARSLGFGVPSDDELERIVAKSTTP